MDRKISRILLSRLANCIAIQHASSKQRTCRCKTTNTGDRIIDSLFLLAGAPCYVMYRGCSRSLVRLSLILAFDLLLMEPMRYVTSCTKRSPNFSTRWIHNSPVFIPTVYYIVRSIASNRCKANTNPTTTIPPIAESSSPMNIIVISRAKNEN